MSITLEVDFLDLLPREISYEITPEYIYDLIAAHERGDLTVKTSDVERIMDIIASEYIPETDSIEVVANRIIDHYCDELLKNQS